MYFQIWSQFFLLVCLTAPNFVHASSSTDEFVIEQTFNLVPISSSSDAFIVASEENRICFAYRASADTQVIFGYGPPDELTTRTIDLSSTEFFNVAVLQESCLLFYTKNEFASSFNIYVVQDGGAPSPPFFFGRSADVVFTLNAIRDPMNIGAGLILGFSFSFENEVLFAMIRYNASKVVADDRFQAIYLDAVFSTSLSSVKSLNFHQYGSQNLSVVAETSLNPRIRARNINATFPASFYTEDAVGAGSFIGMASQVHSADSGLLCYNSLPLVLCRQWNPSTSQISISSVYSGSILNETNIALGLLSRDTAGTVLFQVDDEEKVLAIQIQGNQLVSTNELTLLGVQSFSVSNIDLSNRLYLLTRNATGEMQLVQVRYDFCGNSIKNSRELCDGSADCNQNCTLLDGSPSAIMSPGDISPGRDVNAPNNQGNAPPTSSPEEVPISTLVPAIVIPIVVVAAGVIVLLLLLRRRKKRKGSLLHGKSRVEIAMESIDDRLKIPYKSLVFKKEIGAGSYGKVYVGEWKGTPVAIKVSSSVTDMDGFFDEARITVGLQQHPNVVQTFGVSLDGQLPCIVLEFCEGGSLDNRLFDSDVTMTQQQKVALIKGIARGLYHLHSNNIVHRDLAARNVLLNKSGTPKISDFGMSHVLKSEAEKGKTRTNYGPIRWMAPESLKDLQYSTKSDVWSFGIVLYEIVSRKEPHIDIDPLEVAVKIKNESYHPSIPQGVNSVLSELMLSCWQSEPNNRPSMEQICNKLNSAFPED